MKRLRILPSPFLILYCSRTRVLRLCHIFTVGTASRSSCPLCGIRCNLKFCKSTTTATSRQPALLRQLQRHPQRFDTMGGKGKKFRNASALASTHHSLGQKSSNKGHQPLHHDRLHKLPQKSQYPQQTFSSKKHQAIARLPIQLKRPAKFNSSVKRSRTSTSSSSGNKAKAEVSGTVLASASGFP